MRPIRINTGWNEPHHFLLPVKIDHVDGKEFLVSYWEWRDGWRLVELDKPLLIIPSDYSVQTP